MHQRFAVVQQCNNDVSAEVGVREKFACGLIFCELRSVYAYLVQVGFGLVKIR